MRTFFLHLALFTIAVAVALFWNLMDIMIGKKTGMEARRHFFGFIWGYLMCLALLLVMSI